MQVAGEVEVLGDVLLVTWQGKIVFGDEPSVLSKKVRDEYPAFRRVIVNLEKVELRPGDIPGLLVQYLSAYAAGYRIRFCSASNRVREVLESTRVTEVFQLPIDETKEESIAAFHCSYTIPRAARSRAAAS